MASPERRPIQIRYSAGVAAAFVPVYVALDFLSYIEPFTELGLTVWNPNAALALALALGWGKRAIAPTWIAAYLASLLVREFPPLSAAALLAPSAIAGGYGLVGAYYARNRFPPDFLVETAPTVATFVRLFAAAGLISVALVLASVAGGDVPVGQAGWAILGNWLGDSTGIVVILPAFFVFRRWKDLRDAAAEFATRDGAVYAALMGAALLAMFVGADDHTLQFAYLSLLPIVWISSRREFPAAVVGTAILQCSFVALVYLDETPHTEFFEFQLLMLVIALTGLLMSTAATSSRRKGLALGEQRKQIDRLERTTAIAALGASLAHELSQPISAVRAATYVAQAAASELPGEHRLRASLDSIKGQIELVSERVARLRFNLRQTGTGAQTVAPEALVREAIEILAGEYPAQMARTEIDVRSTRRLRIDREQILQVLVNLLRNAATAVAALDGTGRLRVEIDDDGRTLSVRVLDNGGGLDPDRRAHPFEPVYGDGMRGLGLGLFICRTLCELNGVQIRLATAAGWSTCFELRVPLDDEA